MFVVEAGALRAADLDRVERDLWALPRMVGERMDRHGTPVSTTRVRLITFRNAEADSSAAQSSGFMSDREYGRELPRLMEILRPRPDPAAAVLALKDAIGSDWCVGDGRARHVVIVWAANPVTVLPEAASELAELWDTGPSRLGRRLLIFAPDAGLWDTISSEWDEVIHYPSVAGENLHAADLEQILDLITGSI